MKLTFQQEDAEPLVKALKAIRNEARKGKPDPDVIYHLANDALLDRRARGDIPADS